MSSRLQTTSQSGERRFAYRCASVYAPRVCRRIGRLPQRNLVYVAGVDHQSRHTAQRLELRRARKHRVGARRDARGRRATTARRARCQRRGERGAHAKRHRAAVEGAKRDVQGTPQVGPPPLRPAGQARLPFLRDTGLARPGTQPTTPAMSASKPASPGSAGPLSVLTQHASHGTLATTRTVARAAAACRSRWVSARKAARAPRLRTAAAATTIQTSAPRQRPP